MVIPEKPSRSALKREDDARHRLAQRLVELPKTALARLELDDELLEAIRFAASRTQKGARRREVLHVSALLRQIDSSVIQERLDDRPTRPTESAPAPSVPTRVQEWLDGLVGERESDVLDEILTLVPEADLPRLRQLARNARKKPTPKFLQRLRQALIEIEGDVQSG